MQGYQVPVTFKAIDRFLAPIKKMGRGVRSFASVAQTSIRRVDRSFIRMGNSIKRAAGSFGLFLGGAALFGVLLSGINIIKDYQQANANLASILNVNVDETLALQKSSQRLGATTKFTAAEVAGLQTEYAKLGFVQSEILGVTEATLSLAAATNTELPQAAKQVGAALRAYGLEATEAGRIADVFAATTSKSGVDMEFYATAMSKVAPVAHKLGFAIEGTSALFGKLADAGFDSSVAAVSTRNLMLKLADSSSTLSKKLGKPVRSIEDFVVGLKKLNAIDLGQALELTDVRSVAAFSTFIGQADKLLVLNNELKNAKGFAKLMELRQLDTLSGSFTKLKSAWEGFVLSMEDGTGTFAVTMRVIVDVISHLLAMAGGFDSVDQATQKVSGTMKAVAPPVVNVAQSLANAEEKARRYADRISVLAKKTVFWAKVIGGVIAAFYTLKVALVAYNIVIGITGALQGVASIAIGASSIAMGFYKATLVAVTAAQWAWSAALAIGIWPLTLIALAIVATIALITVIIKKWDEWGAALTLFMGPLGFVIQMVQSFRKHWDALGNAFTEGGFLGGLKAIALVIADGLLMPLQQLLQLINKFTGLDLGISAITGIRNSISGALGENVFKAAPEGVSINPEATRERTLLERSISETAQTVKLTVEDPNQLLKVDKDGTDSSFQIDIDSSFMPAI